MSLANIKKNHLLYLSFLVYLLTFLLLLSELDRQYYQTEKKNIIINNWDNLFSFDKKQLTEVSTGIIYQSKSGKINPKLESEWLKLTHGIVNGDSGVFKIELATNNAKQPPLLVTENRDKIHKFNHFYNTLFYRNFSGLISNTLASKTNTETIGRVKYYYTTPKNFPPINTLSNIYKLIALAIFSVLTALYLYILKYLIIPTKRVINQIEYSPFASPRIIENPSTLLEKAYNNLARDAILIRMSQKIRDLISDNPNIDRSKIIKELPALVSNLLNYKAAVSLEYLKKGEEEFSLINCYETKKDDAFNYKEYCLNEIFKESRLPLLATNQIKEQGNYIIANLTDADNQTDTTFLVVFLNEQKKSADAESKIWHTTLIKQLSDIIKAELKTLDLQRKYILKEKSKANINLAKNLGHDLTNIIATSKFDIITIKKILDTPLTELIKSAEREKLLRDAINGLLNNTRFLQEIVNIYRSFSYMSQPRFEVVDINKIVDDIINLFLLSTSKKIQIERKYAVDTPQCVIEPRLIKLAIFNIITNAIDSIKKNESITNSDGKITVRTQFIKQAKEVRISIADNGGGIRNSEGNLASQSEINKIFYYGYTTKKDDGGEGLGLNWVWSIINEFHSGRIEPRNLPEGGAEFAVYLKTECERVRS